MEVLEVVEAGVWNSSDSPSSWQKSKDSSPAPAHLLTSKGLLLLAECILVKQCSRDPHKNM